MGRLTLTQGAYLLGFRHALTMRREPEAMIRRELAGMKIVVDGGERDYENAKAVAKATAERDPEVRLH